MFFDTHSHLDDKRFDEDRHKLINSLSSNNISLLVNVGSDINSSIESCNLANKYPFIYASVGVHPHDSKNFDNETICTLNKLLSNKKVVAVGETGLDYYYENTNKEIQKSVFRTHIEIAICNKKPVIIHDRDAHNDCLEIIKDYKFEGVFHCYSGSLEFAKTLLKMGMYLSFTGVITFKNSKKFEDIISYVPDDMILIETDSPYLSPEPFRGQRNNPIFISQVAKKIAQIKGWSIEKTSQITKNNGKRLFKIKE